MNHSRRSPRWIALALLLTGGLMARLVQSDFGAVAVRDIRFQSDSGATLSALLYVPASARAAQPAPGVLAVHGYINSRETQSPYAIELARRGYVVLSLDQRGHGFSDPPAFAEGFGGPAALAYLRTVPEVDPNRIVLSGHSMGGWTVLSAAVAMPDAYQAVVVSGSSTGTFGVPAGDATFPRNFGLVFGAFDEFSATMWGAPTGVGIIETDKLQAQFGADGPVEIGRLYGSFAEGTARRLYQPAQTHPANHITQTGVAPVLEWIQTAVPAPHPIDPTAQRWPWKEFGTLLSLIGGLTWVFSAGPALLRLPMFATGKQAAPPGRGLSGSAWWSAAIVLILLPALTYFPFQGFAARIPANVVFGQNLTTGFMVWALGNGLISALLLGLWYFRLGGRAAGADGVALGLGTQDGGRVVQICRDLGLAVAVVGSLYGLLLLHHALFTADFRWWVVAIKPMTGSQFRQFLAYLPAFTAFFVVTGVVLHGQMRGPTAVGGWRGVLRDAALLGSGIAGLLLIQYVPLLSGGTLAIPSQALLTIVAIQFVILLPITGALSRVYFDRTGRVWPGAFINGLLITWLITAGQATHFGG